MGGILGGSGFWMFEAGEGIADIAGHGEFDRARVTVVVPLESNAAEHIALPAGDGFVFFLEMSDDVVAVLSVDVLDSKVINHKAELDGFGAMLEEAGCDASGNVPTN